MVDEDGATLCTYCHEGEVGEDVDGGDDALGLAHLADYYLAAGFFLL